MMTEILLARPSIKVLRRERDLLSLKGGMRDSCKITAGCGMKNRKSHVYGRYTENYDSDKAGSE